MFAKTGLSLIAAAGVAVGVVGMTMGGASGASVSCAPAHSSAASNAARSASARASNDSSSAGSRGSSANAGTSGIDSSDPTDTSGVTDPAGTDGSGVALPADPTTIIGGATVPAADGTATDPSGMDSSNGSDLPLLHLSENTNPTNAAGATAPRTGTDVIGRSSSVSGLHIFGDVNQGH